jgi:hypothetical protein
LIDGSPWALMALTAMLLAQPRGLLVMWKQLDHV